MKLFTNANKLQTYKNKSCDEDPEQFIRDQEYYKYYNKSHKDEDVEKNIKRLDIINMLDQCSSCEGFKKYMLENPKNLDFYKLKWGSAHLLKDKDNEVCYLDSLYDIYKNDFDKVKNTFLYTTSLRNVLNNTGKKICERRKKYREEQLRRINPESKMSMVSRKSVSSRKSVRRKVSRRNVSRRNVSRRNVSRRKVSRRKLSRRKVSRRKVSRRKMIKR
jgi:hypothetical protein